MPYDLFWNGNLQAFDAYAEKARLDAIYSDRLAWSQGLYIMDAIAQNMMTRKSHRSIYPEEPYLMKLEKAQKQTEPDKTTKLYNNLLNWSAGVKARLNCAPSE